MARKHLGTAPDEPGDSPEFTMDIFIAFSMETDVPTVSDSRSKILLVDDNDTYRNTLQEFFADTYLIQIAENGEAALLSVKTDQPDLILLDVEMPGIDGYEVCRRLKAEDCTREIPIIFLTAFGEDDDQTKGLALGAVDFIMKPSDFSLIKQRIQTHLDLKSHREHLQNLVNEKVKELTRAQQQEQEKDFLMRKILMAAPIAIGFIVNRKIVWCNRATLDITGYSYAELEGQPTIMLYPSAEVEHDIAEKYKELARKGFLSFETQWQAKDGTILDIHANVTALEKGNPAAGHIAAMMDITQQKWAESTLRASEEKFSKMFMLSPDAMILSDVSTGTFIEVNGGFTNLYGWSAEEAIGKKSSDLNLWDNIEDRDYVLSKLLEDGDVKDLELVYRHKNGLRGYCSLHAKIIQLTGNKYILSICRDISEKKRLQKETDRENRLASLGELAAGVAHEINNPNALILYNSEILAGIIKDILLQLDEVPFDRHTQLGGLPFPEALNEVTILLPSIHAAAQRIKQIVGDLRDFSRVDNAQQAELIDLDRLVETSLRLTHNTIKKATDYLEVQLDGNLPPINGSVGRLEQVVINLLINACQALEDSTQKISVSTVYDPALEQVKLLVTDEGCGMTRHTLEHLCEPFMTTKREQGGTGLGLSVSTKIVKEHSGQLNFVSSPGEGTTAILSLPIR